MRYLIIILVFFCSCKAKQKTVERQKEVIEVIEKKEIIKDSVVNIKTETLTIKNNQELELTQADPEKEIIVTNENGKSIIIKGADAIIRESSEVKQELDTISKQGSSIEKTDLKLNKTTKKRETNTTIKTFLSGWFWLVILIMILVFLYKLRRKIF